MALQQNLHYVVFSDNQCCIVGVVMNSGVLAKLRTISSVSCCMVYFSFYVDMWQHEGDRT